MQPCTWVGTFASLQSRVSKLEQLLTPLLYAWTSLSPLIKDELKEAAWHLKRAEITSGKRELTFQVPAFLSCTGCTSFLASLCSTLLISPGHTGRGEHLSSWFSHVIRPVQLCKGLLQKTGDLPLQTSCQDGDKYPPQLWSYSRPWSSLDYSLD